MPQEQLSHADDDARAQYYFAQAKRHGARYPRSFDWPSIEVLLNMANTYDLCSQRLLKTFADNGLSFAAFNVLSILSRRDDLSCSQKELCALLLVSRANVTEVVDTLVRKGLVERRTCEKDRRVCIVTITAEGMRMVDTVMPVHFALTRKVTAVLDDAEKKELSRLLTKLRIGVFSLLKEEGTI